MRDLPPQSSQVFYRNGRRDPTRPVAQHVGEDAVTYPCDAADKPGNEIIFASAFPTKSGRARIVPADLQSVSVGLFITIAWTIDQKGASRGVADGLHSS